MYKHTLYHSHLLWVQQQEEFPALLLFGLQEEMTIHEQVSRPIAAIVAHEKTLQKIKKLLDSPSKSCLKKLSTMWAIIILKKLEHVKAQKLLAY